jgi:hypothetical protein
MPLVPGGARPAAFRASADPKGPVGEEARLRSRAARSPLSESLSLSGPGAALAHTRTYTCSKHTRLGEDRCSVTGERWAWTAGGLLAIAMAWINCRAALRQWPEAENFARGRSEMENRCSYTMRALSLVSAVWHDSDSWWSSHRRHHTSQSMQESHFCRVLQHTRGLPGYSTVLERNRDSPRKRSHACFGTDT